MSRSLFDIGKRLALWFLAGVVMLSGYAITKLEPWAEPTLLPLAAADLAIPFLPWTVWLYGSLTITSLVCWLQVPDQLTGRRLFFGLALAAAICWWFFAFLPTTYPRDLYPLPHLGTASLRELADLRGADSPSNCFPSQHVALAWAMALTWRDFLERPWARPLPVLYAAVVTVCTLTTKQHYLVDVIGGFAVGAFAWGVLRRGSRHTSGRSTTSTGPPARCRPWTPPWCAW